jgi:hypothetical protein
LEEPLAREPEEDERVVANDDEDVDLGSGSDDEGDEGEGEGEGDAVGGSSSSSLVPFVWFQGPSWLPKRPILPPHRPMI